MTTGFGRGLNEGMSMLAQDFAVARLFPGVAHDARDALVRARQYAQAPQNYSLPAFAGIDSGTTPKNNCSGCYGLEYLFQRYLYDRFGGDTYLKAMLGVQTGYTGLQQATGIADAKMLMSDFAIALAASGTVATSDPRFTFTSLNLTTAYADQFGGSRTIGSPVTVGAPSSVTPYMGSFTYFTLGTAALNQNLSAKDLGGGFNLQVGVVQR